MTFQLGDKVKRVYPKVYREKWGFIPAVIEEDGIGEIYIKPNDGDCLIDVIWEDWSVSSESPQHLRLVENMV